MQNRVSLLSMAATCCFMHATIDAQPQNPETGPTAFASSSLKKLSIEELLNVEVTSVSKSPEKLTETASAIQVITQEDIRRSGASNLPEVLRLVTNLQVAQVNSSQWAISARGFNNVLANKLLVLIDGRTVYTPLYGGVFWDAQNLMLADIERIEIISGPGGTLWGSNAVNGVINVITKSAVHTQGALIEAGVGSELKGYGGLRYGGELAKNAYYRIYGTGFKRGSTPNSEGSDTHDEWTMAQGGFQLDWELTQKDKLTLQTNLYDNRPNPDGNPAGIKSRGQNVLGQWAHTYSEVADFQLQVYFDRTWRDFRNGFTERLNTYDVDFQHGFGIGSIQKIVWGVGYRLMDHVVENLELFKFTPDQKKLRLYNIFFQDKISLIPERLDLTLGVKAEHNSYTGMQYQPSARLALSLKNQIFWGAVSRAVRNPSRLDRDFYLYFTPEQAIITGSNNFKSEELLAYELGWRIQTERSFNLSLSAFYNIYDKLRTAEPGPPPLNLPITLGNGVDGYTYGLEFAGMYQPYKWLRFRGGYTLLNKKLSVKSTSMDLNKGSVESNDPQHQFLIQPMMDIANKFELGFVGRFIGDLPNPRVASYWELDTRLSWRPHEILEFVIVGQNLLNDEHVEFIPSSALPRKIERGVYGKVICHF